MFLSSLHAQRFAPTAFKVKFEIKFQHDCRPEVIWRRSLLALALNYLNLCVVLYQSFQKFGLNNQRDFHSVIFISFYISLYIVNYNGVDTKLTKTVLNFIHFIERYSNKRCTLQLLSLVLNIFSFKKKF